MASNVVSHEDVVIAARNADLMGTLTVPDVAEGMVLFAHGSGSSRFSPRNQLVADVLNDAGFATLLFDLLTAEEDELDAQTARLRFDIDLLSARVIDAIDWVQRHPAIHNVDVGLFGASTGAAAALVAAAERPENVRAIVSRGGRPDLAGEHLAHVVAPTLLIVGGNDDIVIGLNEKASQRLQAPCEIRIVAGATHLFEEPGKLEIVAEAARDWFLSYLPRRD